MPRFLASLESMLEKNTVHGTTGYSVRRSWTESKYRGLEERILFNPNGTPSEQLAIIKNDKIVNTMSSKYFVFPNEDLADILDEVANEIGAKPYKKTTNNKGWFNSSGNTLYDKKYGTRALIQYQFPDDKVDITGAGDYVTPTFSGSNSEDGRGGALKILGGNVRGFCDNLVYTFVPASEVSGLNSASHLWNDASHQVRTPEIQSVVKSIKDDRKTPRAGFYTKHSKAVSDIDEIKKSIKEAIYRIKEDNDTVLKRYRDLYNLKLRAHTAQNIVKSLPKAVNDDLEYISIDAETGKVSITSDVNLQSVYNDITESLTYDKSRTWGSTLTSYKRVEKLFIREPLEVLAQ